MLIEKKYQGNIPNNKILNEETSSTTDTYSCEYINNLPNDELPIGTIIEYNGDELPSGWKEVVEIKEALNVMTLSPPTDFSHTSDARYTQIDVPLALNDSIGNKFTYQNNGVVIGSGISKVLVSGQLGTRNQTKDALYGIMISVYRNDVYLTSYRSLWIGTNTQYATEQISPKLINVQEGDIIKMNVYIDAIGPEINIQASPTYLTVEEVPSEVSNVTNNITNNITHNITTNGMALIYSNEEQLIGTWFDKPLYQKTINFGAMPTAQQTKSVAHNVANIQDIWIDNSGSYFLDTANNYYDSSDYDWHIHANATNVVAYSEYNRSSSNAMITIRYTKTTD